MGRWDDLEDELRRVHEQGSGGYSSNGTSPAPPAAPGPPSSTRLPCTASWATSSRRSAPTPRRATPLCW